MTPAWLTGSVRLFLGLSLLVGCGGDQVRKRKSVQEFRCPAPGKALNPEGLRKSQLPDIYSVLNNDNRRDCWGAGLAAIGYIDEKDAFVRLRSFIEGRGAQLGLAEDAVLLQQAYLGVGYLARMSQQPKNARSALDYLIWSTDPHNWEKRSTDWRLDAVMRRELIRTLTTSAVKALGMVRQEKARQHMLLLALDSADRRSFRFKYQLSEVGTDLVAQLINLHVLPPGRVAFATAEVEEAIAPKGRSMTVGECAEKGISANRCATNRSMDTLLAELVDRVRRDAIEAYNLERDWLAARRGEEGFLRAVRKADKVADARLSGLHGQLESLRHLLDEPEDLEAIVRVEKVIFPEGPLVLINAEVHDQVNRALAALAVLEERFAPDLKRLKLENHVRTAEEAHTQLDAALKLGLSGKGYDTVIARRSQLQISLRVLMAAVVVRYPGWVAGEKASRDKVLGPIMDQNEQISSYLRRLVQVRDIDPNTGQELAPLADEGTAASRGRQRIPAKAEARQPPAPEPEGDPEDMP